MYTANEFNGAMKEINRLRALVREFGETDAELGHLADLLGVERPESNWTPDLVVQIIIRVQGLLAELEASHA